MTPGQAVGAWLDSLLGNDGLFAVGCLLAALLLGAMWAGLRLWWRWCDAQDARRRREWALEQEAEKESRARRFVVVRIEGFTGGLN